VLTGLAERSEKKAVISAKAHCCPGTFALLYTHIFASKCKLYRFVVVAPANAGVQ